MKYYFLKVYFYIVQYVKNCFISLKRWENLLYLKYGENKVYIIQ